MLTEEEAQDFWGDGYVEFWNEDDGGYAAGYEPPPGEAIWWIHFADYILDSMFFTHCIALYVPQDV